MVTSDTKQTNCKTPGFQQNDKTSQTITYMKKTQKEGVGP